MGYRIGERWTLVYRTLLQEPIRVESLESAGAQLKERSMARIW
jgi:hypothetical protein